MRYTTMCRHGSTSNPCHLQMGGHVNNKLENFVLSTRGIYILSCVALTSTNKGPRFAQKSWAKIGYPSSQASGRGCMSAASMLQGLPGRARGTGKGDCSD